MYLLLLLYVLPGILNMILFRDATESAIEIYGEYDAYWAYAIASFTPVLNLILCIYFIIIYVFQVFR